ARKYEPLHALQFPQADVDRDPRHPGREVAGFVKPVDIAEHLDKRVLHGVFRFLTVAQVSDAEPHQPGGIVVEQRAVRVLPALPASVYDVVLCQAVIWALEIPVHLKLSGHRPVSRGERHERFYPEAPFKISPDPVARGIRKMRDDKPGKPASAS